MTITSAVTASKVYAEQVRHFGRHLVCLTVSYQQLDGTGRPVGGQRLTAFSGFVMAFDGEWFFVTAGHCLLEGIDEKVASGQVRLTGACLNDDFGPNALFHTPVMIAYEAMQKLALEDRQSGLDIGMLHLGPLYRSGLQANGVVPITEANWLTQPEVMDGHLLLGVPECRTRPTEPVPGPTGPMLSASISPHLLYVDKVEAPPDESSPTDHPWFVGRVYTEPFGLESVVGMSGGPIFGFRQQADGSNRYWVVAWQSWWNKEKRVIYGCSLPEFARRFQQAVRIARQTAEVDTRGEPNSETPALDIKGEDIVRPSSPMPHARARSRCGESSPP